MTNALVNVDREKFWKAFSPTNEPDFRGKRVLDVGCGRGERCFEILSKGAACVVGLDTSEDAISLARIRLEEIPDTYASNLSFHLGAIDTLDEGQFDIIISEDTFEHILNLHEVLELIFDKTLPGGRAFIGFGPLYYSPFGDHGWMRQVLPCGAIFSWPWGHVIFSERYIFKKLSKLHDCKITNVVDWPYLALNKKTATDFENEFSSSRFVVQSIARNPAYSVKGKLMWLLGRLPFARKYLVWGMYVVLLRDD